MTVLSRLGPAGPRDLVRGAVVGRRRSTLWALLVLGVNCLLAVALFSSAWAHPASSWIGDDGDPHLMIWGLAWTPHSLESLGHPLVTNFIMYPASANLMWATSLIFPALVLWPVTALFGPVVAFNLLTTLALAISGWVAYLVVRRYASNELMAALAGIVYGFSPYMVLQSLGHTHLIIAIVPPRVWLLLDELLVRRRWHPALLGALLGAACGAQLLTSTEILATTALVAAVGVGLLAMLHRRQVRGVMSRAAAGMAAAIATFLLLYAYPLKVLLFGPQRVSGRLQPLNVYVADLLSFVTSPGYRFLDPPISHQIFATFTGNRVETGDAYLGLPGLVILTIAVLGGRRSAAVRFAGLFTLAVMVLALGPSLHVAGHVTAVPLPWALIQQLPLMENAIPARLMLFAWLGAAIVLGVMGSRLLESGRRGAVAVLGASVLFAVPLFPTSLLLTTPAHAPDFFTPGGNVARVPQGSVALIAPFANEESSTAMYWQLSAGFRFRMPEGEAYVPGPAGPSLSPPSSDLQQDLVELDAGSYPVRPPAGERVGAVADLRRWDVDTIVVGPSPGESRVVAFFTRVTGRPPERTQGVWVWWNVRSFLKTA
jgi:hypothetical protein